MKISRGLSLSLAVLLILTMVAPVLAQGPDTVYEWAEVGFSINYPAGWITGAPDSETRILVQDPNYDIDSNDPPNSPAIALIAMPAEFMADMGSATDVFNMFASEFGGDSEIAEISVAGYDALRIQGTPDDGFLADMVMLVGDDYLYFVMGITPEGQDFTDLFNAMLETIVIAAPATAQPEPQPAEDAPMVNAVRITVDQTIIGSWNEIDAVELVGADVDGVELSQWAIDAEATSQYGTDSWSALQATGAPDTLECGDVTTAWASETSTGLDSLTLYYGMPMAVSEVNIYQTYNPGSIIQVELLPASGEDPIVIFEGVDSTTECPGVFSIPVETTTADSGAVIAYGDTLSGALDNDTYYQDWTFSGVAGDVVTITMVATSGDLDSFVYLLDANGTTLFTNDDADDTSVGTFNSQIASYTLPADGTFTIRATRFGDEFGGTTGTYDLTLNAGGAVNPGPAAGGSGSLVYGDTASGSITDSTASQVWTFSGEAGDVVTITMATEGMVSLDAFLVLQDNTGNELASNDDAGVESLAVFDSQILGYTLPYSGEYTIVAGRISGTGDYLLTLASSTALAANTLIYGDTVTGEISDETIRELWSFEGAQGDIITITMIDPTASPTLDSYLSLLGPDGNEVTNNDDAVDTTVGAFNAQIAKFTLPESGSYTIVATRFGEEFGSGTGSYELSLTLSK